MKSVHNLCRSGGVFVFSEVCLLVNNGKRKLTIWSRNFICVLIANSLLGFSHTAVNTLVATYATYLGAGPKLMGLLTGMFFGVALAMRPVAGPVTTRVNKRILMISVFGLGCLVNLGYALFHNITMFVIFRFLNGVQYSLIGSLCVTLAADSLPPEKMASGLGVFGVGSAAATAVAPSIGIWLKELGTSIRDVDLGFTFVFLLAAIGMGIALIPCILLIPDKKSRQDMQMVGKWYSNIATKHAIVPTIVMTLVTISYSLYNAYTVNFGTEANIAKIGIFFTVLAVAMLCIRPLSGALTDKLGLKKMLIPGMLIFSLSFIFVGFAKSLPLVLAGAFLAAIGYGTSQPGIQSMCMQCEPPVRRAVASNTLFIGIDLGYFLGPVIGGYIYGASSYRHVMFAGCVPAAVACLIFVTTWRIYSKRAKDVREMI